MIAKKSIENFQKLKNEKELKRNQLVSELKDNFSFFGDNEDGDIGHVLKEELVSLDKDISRLNEIICSNVIIDTTTIGTDNIVFGSIVTLIDLDTDKEYKYQILSSDEIDLENGIISIVSPMGSTLLGKVVGDEFVVGEREYEIISISKD